jgi:hypothetical protein
VTLRFLADENFDRDIVRGLLQQRPDLDVVRGQEVGRSSAPDPAVLEWAAQEGRVLLTHDRDTLPGHAYDRVRSGQPVTGVIEVPQSLPLGRAIEDMLLVAECSREDELRDRIEYLPLR